MLHNTELTNLAYHTNGNKLTINHAIKKPDSILQISEFIRHNQIDLVVLTSITPECLPALTQLILDCKNLRSLHVTFSDVAYITMALVDAINSHPSLFDIAMIDLKAQFLKIDYCKQLDENLKKTWIKYDKTNTSEKSYNTDEPVDRYCDAYIAKNADLFTPCIDSDLYRSIIKLFTSTSLACIYLPQLRIPYNLAHSISGNFYESDKNNHVISRFLKTYDVEKLERFSYNNTETSKRILHTLFDNHRLCVVTLGKSDNDRSKHEFIDARSAAYDNFLTLYNTLIRDVHEKLDHYDLLAAKVILENIQLLLDALELMNETMYHGSYSDERKKAPNTSEFDRLRKTNAVLLTAQYDFNDPMKRHSAFANLWSKRNEDPLMSGFLVNLLISADVSQLPFLNHAHEKYYLILALFMDNPEGAPQTLLRHAFYNAVKVAINPNVASDELIIDNNQDEHDYTFDHCVFFCTLIRLLQQQPDISKSVLDKMPCSMVYARELLTIIPCPADSSLAKMYHLLVAYAAPHHRDDLFISVKETLFKTIDAWIKDPFQFEKDKLKREFREEMLRNQQTTITLLQEQNRLLEEVRKNTQGGPLKIPVRQESISPNSPKLF